MLEGDLLPAEDFDIGGSRARHSTDLGQWQTLCEIFPIFHSIELCISIQCEQT